MSVIILKDIYFSPPPHRVTAEERTLPSSCVANSFSKFYVGGAVRR
nr:MAG TPA: hypothetical protein [Caudoviricetes sp.]